MEIPKRLAPTTETLRALFAKSGNQCAFPKCAHPLIDEDKNFVAQVCHIEDAMPGGRFNEDSSNEERRHYDNLILFCYSHHIKTNNVEKYPVQKLREIKQQHEIQFSKTFHVEEIVLLNVFNELKSIKDDTSEILKNQKQQSEALEKMMTLLSSPKQTTNVVESNHINKIESFVEQKNALGQKATIQLLQNYKLENWSDFTGTEKYKLIANIGICYLELDEQQIAGDHFVESFSYDPENEKALGFLALGYALKGESDAARNVISRAIKQAPENPNAYIALIQLEKNSKGFFEILEQIPSNLRELPEISFALGSLARFNNELDVAINWHQNAVDVATKNKADLRATLASTILESMTNPFQLVSGQLTSESKNQIAYCIELLSESWEEIKDSDLKKSRSWILLNRGIARKFVRDFEGAFEDIKHASTLTDDYMTVRHLAIISFETNKLDYALESLDRLKSIETKDDWKDLDIELFKAKILAVKGNHQEALEKLKNVIDQSDKPKVIEEAQSSLIFTLLALDRFEDAEKTSVDIIEHREDYLRGFIDASKVQKSIDDKEKAISFLDKAFEQLTDESDHMDIQDIAYEYAYYEEYPKAIEALERITDTEIYTELTRTLLKVYYNAGESGKALKLCESIRTNYGPIDIISEIQSVIYESIGDLPRAVDVCEEYLKVYPDDQRVLVRLAFVYARQNRQVKVRSIVDDLIVLGELPLDVLFQLAYLNISVGNKNRGLDIAFEARRKYSDHQDAHQSYVHLLAEFKTLTEDYRKIHKVAVNTAVTIEDEQGNLHRYYICDLSGKLSKEELHITAPLVKSMLDCTTGDKIEIDRGFGDPQVFEIKAVLSKYIFAFQESIDLLNNKFVGAEGVRVFDTKGTGDIKKDFKPIFDSLDQGEDYDNKTHKLYRERQLSIGAISNLRKQNPIKVWSTLIGRLDLGVFSLNLNLTVFKVPYDLLKKGIGIVVDLISLLSLASIGRLDLLEVIPNKKAISQSTIDCIEELIREFNGMSSDGYFTIGKHNGEYVRDEVSKERIESNKKHYGNLLRWIRKNCEVLPCNEALTINSAKKEELDNVLGGLFIDSILIAKEQNYVLLSEEENLRSIAQHDYQVYGVPSYILLHYCMNENIVSRDSFVETSCKLLGLGYKHLPIDADVMLKCAEDSQYKPAFLFKAALQFFDHKVSAEDAAVTVAVDFISKLYISSEDDRSCLELFSPLLMALTKGRDFILIMQKVTYMIGLRFKDDQRSRDEINSIIAKFINSYRV